MYHMFPVLLNNHLLIYTDIFLEPHAVRRTSLTHIVDQHWQDPPSPIGSQTEGLGISSPAEVLAKCRTPLMTPVERHRGAFLPSLGKSLT